MDVLELQELFREVAQDDYISDLHLTVRSRPIVREDGRLKPHPDYPDKLTADEMEEFSRFMMEDKNYEEFIEKGEVDFSYSVPGVSRFRVNAYHQRGSISIALRIIPNEVPTIDSMNLPKVLKNLAAQRMGLLLSTGPTGSGKSTTQAAIINEINQTKRSHVVTLEDPIEYMHSHNKSLVHQREVGEDTTSFARGLRACLRQDPDVILVGEMRDLETIQIALEAAETGHLVLATLHTNSAPATIERIIDVFPPGQQQQVRIQLASVISGVIAQQLMPLKGRQGRVAAFEIMIATPAVRNIILEGKTNQLYSAIQTGGKHDMITMDNYLLNLYNQGKISRETIIRRCNNLDFIQERIGLRARRG